MSHTICRGFRAAGIAAGIKKGGKKDLGLIFSETPSTVAGVFTTNRVKAAPVLLCKERIKGGVCSAVIVNSGCANCCTGEAGMADARAMARHAADTLGVSENLVMTASTGVIGSPLPMDRIHAAMPVLHENLREEGFEDFAEAIMTTDTEPKLVACSGDIAGRSFNVVGIAKGSGMICPDMATMLCFVCTDIAATRPALQDLLTRAVDSTLNCMTIDGDTSTNDTVLLLANGRSGLDLADAGVRAEFSSALHRVLSALTRWLVKDGEGVTKVVEIIVKNAQDRASARKIAYTIAHSPLVKTALFGEDANWGRILAAAGRAGVPLDPDRVDIWFDDVRMVADGIRTGDAAEEEATAVLRRPEFTISVDLKAGGAGASVLTSDLSVEYVKINADYRS